MANLVDVATDALEFQYTASKVFTEDESSALAFMHYDANTKTLAVCWRNSSVVYVYTNIDSGVYEEIIDSWSPGNSASRYLSEATSRNGVEPYKYPAAGIEFFKREVDWDPEVSYEVVMNVNGTVRLRVTGHDVRHVIEKVQDEIVGKMFDNSEIDIVKVERVFE